MQESYELNTLKNLFPGIARNAVDYRMDGGSHINVKLKDGSAVSYDIFDESIRNLPRDSDNMSEIECRKEFGIRLRRIMRRKNISAQDLADRTGISKISISNYLNGRSSPNFYTVDKIAKAVGCSMDELRYID